MEIGYIYKEPLDELATRSEEKKNEMREECGVKELSRPFENKPVYLFCRQWYYLDHIESCFGIFYKKSVTSSGKNIFPIKKKKELFV
jgi:hypothetical protein